MVRQAWPITDAFGTRLSPDELVCGLSERLKAPFQLVLKDDGVVLEVAQQSPRLEPALAWLKEERFVWLPITHRIREKVKGSGIRDERRIPVRTIALAECRPEEADAVLAGLRARLKDDSAPVMSWRRDTSLFLAAARGREELSWLEQALQDGPATQPKGFRVLLDGLEWGVLRRPTVAAPARGPAKITVSKALCVRCGLCAAVCPVGGRAKDCLRCFECVEACPQDARRPVYGPASAMRAEKLRPGWLCRLQGLPGATLPAPHPPSYFLPRPAARQKPRYVLGLAIVTLQEHAAVLLKDGRLVGAVEEEKLARVRHYGWPPPEAEPFCWPMDEAFCRRSIRALLSKEGITLDDVDLIAVNGLPPRFRLAYENAPSETPLPVIRTGRLIYIPHHLCHAASAWRASGLKDAWVLTMDGRGERQTAAVFRGRQGELRQVYELRSLLRRSIGGVYESVTRLLGFGPHGQGSVMALASLGRPGSSMQRWLSWASPEQMSIDETLTPGLRRLPPRDLAASLQAALERLSQDLLGHFMPDRPKGLCLAGGVALNCRMNELLRRRFRPAGMFVQPAANDAGTALGAALQACGGSIKLEDALLGPEFSEEEMRCALEKSGLDFRKAADVCAEAARLLARGQVLGWFQGRLEFGPRALGARSILADPRPAGMHRRVNRIKARESWRPFGPSILAGREDDWFEEPFDSRFMLFTVPVRQDQKAAVAAVLHKDGTTRPQSVHRKLQPLYHRLISQFERLTGVPMVLNTSFNRKGEPIVCTPQDALAAFGAMDLDALVMGPFIVSRRSRTPDRGSAAARLRRLPGGRRLALRVTTKCDCNCAHCTMRDIQGLPDRGLSDALRALEQGRRARCDELVLLRGEPALWPHLPKLAARARDMGYRFIQVQTSGRAFARPGLRQRLLAAVDGAEVTVLGADEATHDALSGVPGSFRETLMGMKVLLAAGKEVLPSVALLRANLERLDALPPLLHRLGARRVQFGFPRPVQMPRDVVVAPLARLPQAAEAVARAAKVAAELGLDVSTEGLPWCHLPAELRQGSESAVLWDRFRVDDLHMLHDGFGSQLRGSRPQPPVCRACAARSRCPRTWALYLEIFGSSELRMIS